MAELIMSTCTQGLIYALISYGVYITYTILDFPDLSVDGSFPLGAAVTAVLLNQGVNPFLTLPVALLFGAFAGLCTGLIHVKLHVRDLLAGIITMTALFSINLQIGGSNLMVPRSINTIFNADITMKLMGNQTMTVRKLVLSILLVLIVKILLDWYLRTKSGLLLRAVGDNRTLVTALAQNAGNIKIKGLMLSNALVALAGCIICHEQRSFTATMGTGQVVFGLAAVIIGISFFKKLSFVKGTTAVVAGSVIYKTCIQIAINVGLPANLLKLITAVMFLLVLVISNKKGEEIIHA